MISRKQRARVAHLHRQKRAIDLMRELLTVNLEPRWAQVPEWNGISVPIVMTNLRKNQDINKLAEAWGVPRNLLDFEALVHHHNGGWGIFALPPLIEVGAWLSKAENHHHIVDGVTLIAAISIHSQLTLSEATGLIVEMARRDREAQVAPRERANEWGRTAIHIVNTWQARHIAGGAGIGDVEVLAGRIHELRDMCATWQINQLEQDIAHIRAKLRENGIAA